MPSERSAVTDTVGTDLDVDMLVIGAGMAGMSAAGYAAQHGARVLVVDKAPEIGGSSVLSGTTLWAAPTMDAFRELCPDGDMSLGQVLVDGFPAALDWVRSSGVEFSGERSVVRFGRGFRFDVLGFLAACRSNVEKSHGWVLPGKQVLRLLREGDRIVGAEVSDDDGISRIGSEAVVLATGGFQADPDLRREHLGHGSDILLRSNPYSTGDGLRLAREVGAGTAGEFSAFYGHSIASPVGAFGSGDFGRLAVQFSAEGVVVNRQGVRFVDESRCDHITAQLLVDQPDRRALVVVDRTILQSPSLGASRLVNGPETVERSVDEVFGDLQRAGAHVAVAEDLRALAYAVDAWSFDGAAMAESVLHFNEAIGRGSDLVPGRQWNRSPVVEPPFWAIEVEPAVTFTHGGVAVDDDARVLRPDGSPIDGLFAAGADIGGLYNGGYAGGLALALVFARQAARAFLAGRSDPAEVVSG
jgi:succinate dehydrogenase/fumarate reductase flavoprotein subunit